MPEISIIIPFKNTEQFFMECLKSVQKQEYDNFEAILINDHSTDSSLEIAESMAIKDPRFIVLSNMGDGIIPALQTGYSKTKGTYITRMDSDDIMSTHKLSDMHAQLKKNGEGYLAVGLVKYFSSKPLGDGFQKYETWLNKLSLTGSNFDEIYKECVIPSPCWMAHRSDFDRIGGFNSTLYPEDYDLAFRFYKHGLKVIPSSETLHHWRDYASRTSRTHPHYSDNGFLDIKTKYFIELDYIPAKQLILWGAGKKGKKIAKSMELNSMLL